MVGGLVGGCLGSWSSPLAPNIPRRPRRVVRGAALLQRAARRPGRRAPGPGPRSPAGDGVGDAGRLPAGRLGDRHLPRRAVRRPPARDVPGPVRDRRLLRPALRGHAGRPSARRGRRAAVVVAGGRRRRSASTPAGTPTSRWAFVSRFLFVTAYAFLTTYQAYYLLERLGTAEADVPRQIFLGDAGPVGLRGRRLARRRAALGLDRAGGRCSSRRGRRLRLRPVRGRAGQRLQRLPRRHGARAGSGSASTWRSTSRSWSTYSRTRCNAAKDLGVLQHRQRAALLRGAGARAGDPRDGRRQLRRPVRRGGLCAVAGALAILPVKGVR